MRVRRCLGVGRADRGADVDDPGADRADPDDRTDRAG
jgi:hypothetical protein